MKKIGLLFMGMFFLSGISYGQDIAELSVSSETVKPGEEIDVTIKIEGWKICRISTNNGKGTGQTYNSNQKGLSIDRSVPVKFYDNGWTEVKCDNEDVNLDDPEFSKRIEINVGDNSNQGDNKDCTLKKSNGDNVKTGNTYGNSKNECITNCNELVKERNTHGHNTDGWTCSYDYNVIKTYTDSNQLDNSNNGDKGNNSNGGNNGNDSNLGDSNLGDKLSNLRKELNSKVGNLSESNKLVYNAFVKEELSKQNGKLKNEGIEGLLKKLEGLSEIKKAAKDYSYWNILGPILINYEIMVLETIIGKSGDKPINITGDGDNKESEGNDKENDNYIDKWTGKLQHCKVIFDNFNGKKVSDLNKNEWGVKICPSTSRDGCNEGIVKSYDFHEYSIGENYDGHCVLYFQEPKVTGNRIVYLNLKDIKIPKLYNKEKENKEENKGNEKDKEENKGNEKDKEENKGNEEDKEDTITITVSDPNNITDIDGTQKIEFPKNKDKDYVSANFKLNSGINSFVLRHANQNLNLNLTDSPGRINSGCGVNVAVGTFMGNTRWSLYFGHGSKTDPTLFKSDVDCHYEILSTDNNNTSNNNTSNNNTSNNNNKCGSAVIDGYELQERNGRQTVNKEVNANYGVVTYRQTFECDNNIGKWKKVDEPREIIRSCNDGYKEDKRGSRIKECIPLGQCYLGSYELSSTGEKLKDGQTLKPGQKLKSTTNFANVLTKSKCLSECNSRVSSKWDTTCGWIDRSDRENQTHHILKKYSGSDKDTGKDKDTGSDKDKDKDTGSDKDKDKDTGSDKDKDKDTSKKDTTGVNCTWQASGTVTSGPPHGSCECGEVQGYYECKPKSNGNGEDKKDVNKGDKKEKVNLKVQKKSTTYKGGATHHNWNVKYDPNNKTITVDGDWKNVQNSFKVNSGKYSPVTLKLGNEKTFTRKGTIVQGNSAGAEEYESRFQIVFKSNGKVDIGHCSDVYSLNTNTNSGNQCTWKSSGTATSSAPKGACECGETMTGYKCKPSNSGNQGKTRIGGSCPNYSSMSDISFNVSN